MAAKTSEYSKSQEGTATVFAVTPAKAPKFTYLIIICAGVCLLGLGMGSAAFVMLPMGGFALWYGWTRDLRKKASRLPVKFRVTPDSIEAEGKTFKVADIHRLLVRNSITDQELNVEVWTTNTNQAAGMAYRAQVARVANTLNLETGGKSFIIAGGMDETTVMGLLQDVCNVTGMKVK